MVEYCSLAPQDRVETLSSSGLVVQQCNVLSALIHNDNLSQGYCANLERDNFPYEIIVGKLFFTKAIVKPA